MRRIRPAAILFTSGSTGPPKGAVYTHGIFEAQVERFRVLYDIEPGEIDLCTFPLFALFAPALGMTAIVPDMDPTRPARVDPDKLFEAIDDFGPDEPVRLAGPAAAGRSGGRRAGPEDPHAPARGHRRRTGLGPGARRVRPAARAAGGDLHALRCDRGPAGRLDRQHARSSKRPRRQTDQGAGVCVGRPVEGVEVRIIRISDEPIPSWSDDLEVSDGTIGEIVVAGPVVTREYFRRPEATALAKIADPRPGHLLPPDGRPRLPRRPAAGSGSAAGNRTGSSSRDTTLYTICCEGVFNAHPDVARVGPGGRARQGRQ